MIMKIIKTFKKEENWFETTEAEMIEKTQGIYDDPLQVLKYNGSIQNVFAIWKIK